MPELPEIETVKNVIGPQIRGLTIENVLVNRPEVVAHPTADDFCKEVTGRNISAMARRGKFLIIALGRSEQNYSASAHDGASCSSLHPIIKRKGIPISLCS